MKNVFSGLLFAIEQEICVPDSPNEVPGTTTNHIAPCNSTSSAAVDFSKGDSLDMKSYKQIIVLGESDVVCEEERTIRHGVFLFFVERSIAMV